MGSIVIAAHRGMAHKRAVMCGDSLQTIDKYSKTGSIWVFSVDGVWTPLSSPERGQCKSYFRLIDIVIT